MKLFYAVYSNTEGAAVDTADYDDIVKRFS
jgi:hypothetical protein